MKIRQRIYLSYLVLVGLFLLFLGTYAYIAELRTRTDSDLTTLYRVKSSWGDLLMSMNSIVDNWDDGKSFSRYLARLEDFQRETRVLGSSNRLRFYYPPQLSRHIDSLLEIWKLAQDSVASIVESINNSDFQRVVQQISTEPGLQRLNHLWVTLFYDGTEAQRNDAYAVRQVLDAIEFFPIFSDTMTRQFDVVASETTAVYQKVIRFQLILSVSFFALFLLLYLTFSLLFTRSISRPITDVSMKLTAFIGDSIERSRRDHKDELDLLNNSVTTLIDHYTYLSRVARLLAEGDIESPDIEVPERGVVGNALHEVMLYLQRLATVSSWIRNGQYGAEVAESSDRDVLGRSFNIMSREIHEKITTLSRVFDAIEEALLVINTEGEVVESNNRLLKLLDVDSVAGITAAGGLEHFVKDFGRLKRALRRGDEREPHAATFLSARGTAIPVRITARMLEPLNGTHDKIMLFITNESWKVRMKRERQRLKAQAVMAELRALRAQINPHFFFNTLNTIAELIESEPEAAVRTIEKLADLFRYAFSTAERETVSVAEEIKHVRQFLQIEQTRFEDNLEVDYDLSAEIEGERVPPMILQPIVENALQHGKDSDGRVHISIGAKRDGDFLVFRIADTGTTDGVGKFFSGRGVGLKNVNNRLRTLYGSVIELEQNRPRGVVVGIRIPVVGHGD